MSFPAILPGEPPWSPSEQAILLDFLRSPVGQLFLRSLFFRRPLVTEARDREARNIQADTLAGYDECIAEILRLSEGRPLSTADQAAQSKS